MASFYFNILHLFFPVHSNHGQAIEYHLVYPRMRVGGSTRAGLVDTEKRMTNTIRRAHPSAGGKYSAFGPTAGGLFTIALPEILRISMGTNFVGAANTIYGALLVIFIIFMPRGVIGLIESRLIEPRNGSQPPRDGRGCNRSAPVGR
jgi:hypothetical protein